MNNNFQEKGIVGVSLMKFIGFRLFFVSLILFIPPLTSVAASGFYTPGYYPAADQIQRDNAWTNQFVRPRFRSVSDRGYAERWQWRKHYPPVGQNRYAGYKFRPFQPNYRYRPTFTLPSANYRMANYRWRPVNNQWQYTQWQNTHRSPLLEPLGPAMGYRGASYLTGKPWGMNPGYRQYNVDYGRKYRFRPMVEVGPEYAARNIHRPINISIPDYYVYRPIKQKARRTTVNTEVDLTAQGIGSFRTSEKNLTEIAQFSVSGDARNSSTGVWSEVSAGLSQPGFGRAPKTSPRRWQPSTDRVVMPPPNISGSHPYVRNEYAFRHSLPYMPAGLGSRPSGDYISSFRRGYMPSRGSPGYLQQQVNLPHAGYAHTEYRTNWYDGQPDGQGAWYKSLQIDGGTMVSQTDLDKNALAEYERVNF